MICCGAMKIAIRRIGNSRGVILPKPVISQLNLSDTVDLTVEDDAVVLRKPKRRVRQGWAEASKRLKERGDVSAVWPTFANEDDKKLTW